MTANNIDLASENKKPSGQPPKVSFNDTAKLPGPLAGLHNSTSLDAAPVCLYVHFTPDHKSEVSSIREHARRSFGLVRRDLLLQIDPSAWVLRAGYILRR